MSGYWPEGDLGDDCDGDIDGYDGGYGPHAPFVPADPTTCTCVDPFSNCPTHG